MLNYNPHGVESLMPKGVEHESTLSQQRYILECVESLMPKGVEHRATPRMVFQNTMC